MLLLLLLLFFSISNLVHCSCPDGFELVSEGQCRGLYYTYPKGGTRYDLATDAAVEKCKEIQAQAIIIHNEEEQQYWTSKSTLTEVLVLGMVCNTASKKWEWADGSAVDFKPKEGYDSIIDSNCTSGCTSYMVLGIAGHWYINCAPITSTLYQFVVFCTKQIHQPTPSIGGCEKFAEDSDDGACYQVGDTAESWQDAQLICKKLGANLASIHNSKENAFVRRLAVSKGAVHGVFLGATVSGEGRNFGWIDGSDWDFTNFYPGFPKSGFGDCIALDTSVTSGQWMNVECSSQIPVACVREPVNPICSFDALMEGAIFASPGFPFDASTPCDYYLEADAGKKVEVEVAFLEANSCCDSLILYEGYFGGFVIANLTGEIRNLTYTTQSNIMRVSWQPNGGVNVRGMAMMFRGV